MTQRTGSFPHMALAHELGVAYGDVLEAAEYLFALQQTVVMPTGRDLAGREVLLRILLDHSTDVAVETLEQIGALVDVRCAR